MTVMHRPGEHKSRGVWRLSGSSDALSVTGIERLLHHQLEWDLRGAVARSRAGVARRDMVTVVASVG